MAATYTLRFTKAGQRARSTKIVAEDSLDATIQAIGEVLNRAMRDPFYATARVELRDAKGTVLHVMEEK